MTPADLTRALKERARALGFDAAGIAAAGRLERDGAALAAWLAGNREAGMAWMARAPETRVDPGKLLPGCRYVVALAVNYGTGPGRRGAVRERARVALYAQGRDYHKVLRKMLADLSAWLEDAGGAACRICVDTGPVLERAWAERAGIGWIGKNSNLLTRTMGSWLLLGEVLTCADLVPDTGPDAGFCGTCTACIDACPTGAIVADGTVDANRCISYWTIEHRGAIPERVRAGLGDWIFGCDDCQTVCPWNESFSVAAEDRLGRRDDLSGLDPVEVLGLDEGEFRRRFSGTALMRAKWQGLRRNACIVLGNRREPGALPALTRALQDADPVVREHAAWAIARIEEGGAI